MERLNEDGAKHMTEVKQLLSQNKEITTKAEELEQRVHDAHERYVKSKGKSALGGGLRKAKRSTSNNFENNAYASGK